jgi:hypothetical protein
MSEFKIDCKIFEELKEYSNKQRADLFENTEFPLLMSEFISKQPIKTSGGKKTKRNKRKRKRKRNKTFKMVHSRPF